MSVNEVSKVFVEFVDLFTILTNLPASTRI